MPTRQLTVVGGHLTGPAATRYRYRYVERHAGT